MKCNNRKTMFSYLQENKLNEIHKGSKNIMTDMKSSIRIPKGHGKVSPLQPSTSPCMIAGISSLWTPYSGTSSCRWRRILPSEVQRIIQVAVVSSVALDFR